MLFKVIDTETTGLENAQVVELAVTTVGDASTTAHFGTGEPSGAGYFVGATRSAYVKPTVSIENEAKAVHHIVEADVAGADDWPTVRHRLASDALDATLAFVAHNAAFDRQFFEPVIHDRTGREVPWICTYRCAYELLRTEPSHKNGVLRYALGLPTLRERAEPAHRAGPDTYVTAHLLAHLLSRSTVPELIEISARPRYLRTLGFGKHATDPIADVPNTYLKWMREQGPDAFDVDVDYTMKREMQRRNDEWLARKENRS